LVPNPKPNLFLQLCSCSCDCYKVHKSTADQCVPLQTEPKDLVVEDKTPLKNLVFTTVDSVEPDKLKLLADSEELKNLLYNPHLRQLLRDIDSDPNAWQAMKLAMVEPLFTEFADVCLKIVE
jgi:zinc finger HIT domain-containing protein 3